MAQEIDINALTAQANAALKSVGNMDFNDNFDDNIDVDNMELNDDDMNDPDLLAQLNDIGYNDEENETKDNNIDDDERDDDAMFEEMKQQCLKDVNKKIGTIKNRYNEFYQNNNLGNAKLLLIYII